MRQQVLLLRSFSWWQGNSDIKNQERQGDIRRRLTTSRRDIAMRVTVGAGGWERDGEKGLPLITRGYGKKSSDKKFFLRSNGVVVVVVVDDGGKCSQPPTNILFYTLATMRAWIDREGTSPLSRQATRERQPPL